MSEETEAGASAGLDATSQAAQAGMAERALELLQAGGPVVAILLAMSVLALALVFLKLWQLRAARVGETQAARHALALYRAGRTGEALAAAEEAPGPTAAVLARAIRGRRRGLPEASVREEAFRYGSDLLESLRTGLRPLEVIASLAPLLGLFGTVLGMIEAFQQLEGAQGRVSPALLAGGIWEALLTTAVGLGVAIPVVALLSWLERRIDRLAHAMESTVTQVFTEDLSAEAPAEEEASDGTAGLRAASAAE